MPRPLVDDDLWAVIEPLLPPPKRRRKRHPGRKPIGDRETLSGILFVLRSGIPWEMLPKEMGCGSGMTCWRRLKAWQAAGACGGGCTASCSRGCGRPTASTSRARSPIPPRSAPWARGKNWTEPNRSP